MALPDLQHALDLLDEGHAADALPTLTAWAERMPAYAAAHVLLGRAYEALGQTEPAHRAWQQASFLMPNSPAVVEGLERTRPSLPEEDDAPPLDLDALEAPSELDPGIRPPPEPAPPEEPAAEAGNETLAPAEESSHGTGEEEAPEPSPEAERPELAALATGEDVALAEPEQIPAQETRDAVPPEIPTAEPADDAVEDDAVEDDAVEDDAVEDDAVEDDAVEDDAVEDDAVEDDAVEDDAVEDDRSEIVRAALAAANAPDAALADAPEATDAPIPRSIYAEIDALIAEQRQAAPAPPPAAEEEPLLDLDAWDEFDAVFEDEPPPETPPPAAPPGIDDLDRLIEELESARIVPDPAFEDVPALDDDQDDPLEDMVSETLARIYASQEKYAEAARVYDQLARQHPERADAFAARAEEMRGRAGEA